MPLPAAPATSPPSRAQDHDPESPSLGRRPGQWPPRMENSNGSQNPRMLGSWARRTGFRSNMSGESAISTVSDTEAGNAAPSPAADSKGNNSADLSTLPKTAQPPQTDWRAATAAPKSNLGAGQPVHKRGNESENVSGVQSSGPLNRSHEHGRTNYRDSEADAMSQSQEDDVFMAKQSHMKYEIRETPGLVPLIFYGLQHYFSIIGSIVLTPLVFVPAMGGTDEEVAKVVSTVLLVTGLTTLLHTYFGSRLPLIQGPSFVYLAPILTIIFSPDFGTVNQNRFRHIMRELQGAVIISSMFQIILGYSGLMSFLLRVINPVVVAPTIAAVGLAFFSYAFPVVGTCVEIGLPQILIVLFFALYLRKISIFGHRIFQVYAVPLGLSIIWAYAFLLTETGAYNYKGCSMKIPVSADCQRHVFTMKHCRTDVSTALKAAAWFRFPYPFQWGSPRFHMKTGLVMTAASIIATVDSVGTYHATSLLVASRAPSPGVVSRSIGMEGITSILAGVFGTGAGSTTLTENVHTIAVTKMGSRRAVELGAVVLILLSLIGKVGAFIASIPAVMVAGLLGFMWTLVTALGLSNLRYSETGSSRNVLIVGLSLFTALSLPAYFQNYGKTAAAVNATTEPYFHPYAVSQHGPVKTSHDSVNYVMNSVLSMHMVVAFLVAFVLDNTVPGSRQERGVYVWCRSKNARNEPAVVKDYGLPVGRKFFTWVKWVGL